MIGPKHFQWLKGQKLFNSKTCCIVFSAPEITAVSKPNNNPPKDATRAIPVT
jgi:hypothetical protein